MADPTRRSGLRLNARDELSEHHIELFWARVDRSGGPDACWPRRGARARNGYSVFGVTRRTETGWNPVQWKSHRIAWSLTNGEIPDGMVIRHSCDNPPCCNPAHLLIGTGNDNVADKVSRDRQSRGEAHSRIMRVVHARGEGSGNAKLTEEIVREMRAAWDAGTSTDELMLRYGVSRPTVYRVTHRRSWRHVA